MIISATKKKKNPKACKHGSSSKILSSQIMNLKTYSYDKIIYKFMQVFSANENFF